MICPMCAVTVPVCDTDCPSCGARLGEYAAVWYLPDRWFNEGIVRLERDDPVGAASRFAQVCGLRPDDIEAKQAWALACRRSGRLEEAAGLLLDVLEARPSPETDQEYAEVMALLTAPPAAAPTGPRTRVTSVRVVRVKQSRAARRKRS